MVGGKGVCVFDGGVNLFEWAWLRGVGGRGGRILNGLANVCAEGGL